MKKVNILLIILFCFNTIKANVNVPKETNQNNIEISILTCGPGKEIYSLFGHTAIRVQILDQHYDKVFNYGMFNFNSDHFVLRFALGQTDYQLAETPYDYFLYEYTYFKRDVWEQVLNLSYLQKIDIIKDLRENLKPENISYRYNFFYDNCSTRPLDKISSRANKLQLPSKLYDYDVSYRDIIYKYSETDLWARFGMNLCIGNQADKPLDIKQLSFAPIELMNILDSTYTENGKLAQPIKSILSFSNIKDETKLPSPLATFTALFILITLISYWGYIRKNTFYILDSLLFAIFGIAGSILFFLAIFSEHPTVSSNFLLIVFHPLHLIWAPILWVKEKKRSKIHFHYVNLVILTLFILFYPLIPQRIEFAILPLTLCLWIRSFTYILFLKKINK